MVTQDKNHFFQNSFYYSVKCFLFHILRNPYPLKLHSCPTKFPRNLIKTHSYFHPICQSLSLEFSIKLSFSSPNLPKPKNTFQIRITMDPSRRDKGKNKSIDDSIGPEPNKPGSLNLGRLVPNPKEKIYFI